MPASSAERFLVVAGVSWRGALAGRRGLGLSAVAAVFPLIILALASTRRTDIDLVAASELLYSDLFLPVLLLLLCLVLGISLFRGEIEDETIVYPVMRSIPRSTLAIGKFVGLEMAALTFLLPAVILGFGLSIVLNTGPQVTLAGVGSTILLTTVVAALAYGAFFLLLGLLTRQALIIGLLYGFFWETFVPLLPGPVKEVTLVYYLRNIGGQLTVAGPFAQVPTNLSLLVAVGVPLGFALVTIVLTCLYLVSAELNPAPSPA